MTKTISPPIWHMENEPLSLKRDSRILVLYKFENEAYWTSEVFRVEENPIVYIKSQFLESDPPTIIWTSLEIEE